MIPALPFIVMHIVFQSLVAESAMFMKVLAPPPTDNNGHMRVGATMIEPYNETLVYAGDPTK